MAFFSSISTSYYRWRQRAFRVRSWPELNDEWRGKSIALVGNAGYLAQQQLGQRIDAHDVVIRMNNFQTDGFEQAVGARTDCWLTNFYHDVDFNQPQLRQAKWIVASVPNNWRKDRGAGIRNRHGEHITRGLIALDRNETFAPNVDWFGCQIDRFGKYPTTGALGILLLTELLNLGAARILLTGFSFFAGPTHYFSSARVNPINHDPDRERAIVRERVVHGVRSGSIALDPMMSNYLKIDQRRRQRAA